MTHFDIPERFHIPFYDHGDSLMDTIKASSSRRKMNPICFAYRKLRNIILYRLAFFCPINKWRIWMHRKRGCHIGEHVVIGQQCSIDNAYPELVYIEDYVGITGNNSILCHTNMRPYFDGIVHCMAAPVIIRHHALVAIGAVLMPGVEIGEYAMVSANSVVTSNVPPYTLVVGNPAKKVFEYKKRVLHNIKKYGLAENMCAEMKDLLEQEANEKLY